ncbi:MAG: AraC family transcriptional regulator, partial [Bacteroidota bacterium]
PEYEKIQVQPLHSFLAKIVERPKRPSLKDAWHFHPEVEICFTTKSEGKRFVGNNIEDYKSGDLVMFGSNLPHGYITERESSQVVIQMQESFLGNEFLDKPETQVIKDLFFKAKRGLKFVGKAQKEAEDKIRDMLELNGLPQIIKLLELLYLFASTADFRYITQESYIVDAKMTELKRIRIVYSYILENYRTGVSLEEAAALIPMTKSSFCKFLKKHAKKTFSEIVNEIRISHACELMIQTDMKISSIAYESGFNDISYFNRIFKKIMKSSPKEFMSTKQDYEA